MKAIQKRSISMLMAFMMVVIFALTPSIDSQAAKKAKASDYAAIFDATYYATKYPDLKAAFGTNESALLNHFLSNGMAEGRQGCEEFNVQAYRARYADLQAAFGDDLKAYYMHYLTSGKAEGRNGRAAAAPAQAAPQTAPQATPAQPAGSAYPEQVVALVNQDRARNGLPALTMKSDLQAAAQARAVEIAQSFSHTRPNGTSCFTIADEYGVTCFVCGENIAAGQPTPASVEDCWMNSSGHRSNILKSTTKYIGVGYYSCGTGYGTYWVQLFGM